VPHSHATCHTGAPDVDGGGEEGGDGNGDGNGGRVEGRRC